MVIGLDIFKEHFKGYTNQYILIGGGACDRQFNQKGLPYRVTKDLDIILVVEALNNEFVEHFWKFIKNGEYELAQRGEKKLFYRFIDPRVKEFPKMLELFSRVPDAIKEQGEFHLTDIPVGEEQSSLSAILLDDDYYKFTLANSELIDGLKVANDIALISLKTRAFLNNKKRKEQGQEVRTEDIAKHKNDVIRITATINPEQKANAPEKIISDLKEFIEVIREENSDLKPLFKSMGVAAIELSQIVDQLKKTFGLV